jgi:hypothetical protein
MARITIFLLGSETFMPVVITRKWKALLFRSEKSPYQTASYTGKAIITFKKLQLGIFLRSFTGRMIVTLI